MELELGYGRGSQQLSVPDRNLLEVLLPNRVPLERGAEEAVRWALEHPVGSPRLRDIVRPGETVALITSDITRPVPTWAIAPAVLEELYAAGVSPQDVTLVFGLGSHRGHTEAERARLAGERVYREVRCVDSDPDDCVRLGVTRRGTPVDITRVVAEADRRICLGNVEFHWFAGYSGGAKAIMPGVSTRAAIAANHSLMASPEARAARLEGNPVREDLEEAAALCGVDFLVNVVLSEHKEIVYAAAGDVTAAHRDACRVLERLYRKPIPRPADIVVVSQGGAPKDMNLYQLQKALDNASHAVRPGGVIVLVGSCPEGFGEAVFARWMREAASPEAILRRIGREFCIGGHKAAAFAKVLAKAEIVLVSDMDPADVRAAFLRPAASAQAALDAALEKLGGEASVLVMPYGGATLPQVCGEEGGHG